MIFVFTFSTVFSQVIQGNEDLNASKLNQNVSLSNKTYSVYDGGGNSGVTCFDTWYNGITFLDELNSVQLASCRGAYQNAGDPNGWIECNQFAMDSYFAMHSVIDAAYARCQGNQN